MIDHPTSPQGRIRFGAFEADLKTAELRKFGVRIKLQGQPFRVLAALLDRPGEIVTREELRSRVWGDETTVDFDHGLGTAINKIREALNDSADSPRYIETLARRGFRFIAPLTGVDTSDPLPAVVAAPSSPAAPAPVTDVALLSVSSRAPEPHIRNRASFARRIPFWATVAAIQLTAALAIVLGWSRSPAAPNVRFNQITWSDRVYPGEARLERFPGLVTDGVRVYFSQLMNGRISLASASVAGGEVQPIVTPLEIPRPIVADVSKDGSKLLIRNLIWSETEQPLWIIPSTGGSAHRIPDVLAHDAAWTPNGQSIICALGRDLRVIRENGQTVRKLVSLSGRAFWIRHSPDGSRIRFTVVDSSTRATSLWEVSSEGENLRLVLPKKVNDSSECCGSWTDDGKQFIFESSKGGASNVWALRESRSMTPFAASVNPIQITDGPLHYSAPIPVGNSGRILVIGAHNRNELSVVDVKSQRIASYLPALNARRINISKDGQWVAWLSTADGSLWRSRFDGTQRLQLTSPPMRISGVRWSPDGRTLAFAGRQLNKHYRIYLISADGGRPELLLGDQRNQLDPSWSPDGKSLAFGRPPEYGGDDSTQKVIEIVDRQSKSVRQLPGSIGLFSPRWSPDGRYIAAISLDQTNLSLFDTRSSKWTVLSSGNFDHPEWSRDGKHIYFRARVEGDPLYQISVATRRLEKIADFHHLQPDTCRFVGLSPSDGLIVSIQYLTANIYSIQSPL